MHSMKQTVYFFFLLMMLTLTGTGPITAKAPERRATTVDDIYKLVNKYRQSKGLKPLKLHETINKEAAKHSRNMANGSVAFGHDGFNSRFDRLAKAIPNATSMAENVQYTSGNAAHVVDNWIHSPVHKKNMEGDYNLTGIGIATSSSGQVYYTQIFIKN